MPRAVPRQCEQNKRSMLGFNGHRSRAILIFYTPRKSNAECPAFLHHKGKMPYFPLDISLTLSYTSLGVHAMRLRPKRQVAGDRRQVLGAREETVRSAQFGGPAFLMALPRPPDNCQLTTVNFFPATCLLKSAEPSSVLPHDSIFIGLKPACCDKLMKKGGGGGGVKRSNSEVRN